MVASALALIDSEWDEYSAKVGALDPEDFERRTVELDDEAYSEALRARFRWNQAEFARYCWPDRFDLPFNECHGALFSRPQHYLARPSARDAVAAPRGLGKSTIASFAEVIHRIVNHLERFVIIVSAEEGLAIDLVDDIREAFKGDGDESDRLRELYGPFDVKGGKSDFTVSVNGARRVRVLARSFGQQIRGKKYKGDRPTLIVIDDGERSDKVRSPTQRAYTWRFLTDDIGKAGRKQGGTEIKIRGTVLHVDSMLATCLRDEGPGAGWESKRFSSIISWPEREDLWEQCGRIWKNLALGEHRKAAAYAFYKARRNEMDKGAEVLDPVAEPLFSLYETIWGEGLASFLREKQNQPRHGSAQLFDSKTFARCRVVDDVIYTADDRIVRLADCTITVFLDPIPGEDMGDLSDDAGSGAGDYAAIAVIARDRFGYAYVLQVWLKRTKDSVILATLWGICERWSVGLGPVKLGIETNSFARFFGRDFRREQRQRQLDEEFWQVNVEDINSSTKKEDRIAALEAPATNNWLQFSEAISVKVLGQFDDFPNGSHDDGPDAVHGAWSLSGGFQAPRMSGQRLHK